jgi:hypothetical protein
MHMLCSLVAPQSKKSAMTQSAFCRPFNGPDLRDEFRARPDHFRHLWGLFRLVHEQAGRQAPNRFLRERNEAAPPLHLPARLDIVSAYVVEHSILTHSKHGEPGR